MESGHKEECAVTEVLCGGVLYGGQALHVVAAGADLRGGLPTLLAYFTLRGGPDFRKIIGGGKGGSLISGEIRKYQAGEFDLSVLD